MLEDVGHSRGVWWVRLEANGEDIVRVVSRDVQIFGARLVMLEMEGGQLKLRHLPNTLKGESMELLARLWKVGDVC
jgi:hypothetical protein